MLQSSIVAQYWKKNMIKFSQQPVTKQQKIIFLAHDLNLGGHKIKSTLAYKIFSTLETVRHSVTLLSFAIRSHNNSNLSQVSQSIL